MTVAAAFVKGADHQVFGVNAAVESVRHQEELKKQFPPEKRLAYRVVELPKEAATDADLATIAPPSDNAKKPGVLELVESAHPDLGKLGVFFTRKAAARVTRWPSSPRGCVVRYRLLSHSC